MRRHQRNVEISDLEIVGPFVVQILAFFVPKSNDDDVGLIFSRLNKLVGIDEDMFIKY